MRTVTYDENEWALVPKKPTSAMKTAGIGVEVYQSPTELDSLSWEEVTAIYEAMTAAAPDHPATTGDAPKRVDVLTLKPFDMLETKNWGLVEFLRWDDYMGERSAEIRSITHGGTYFPFQHVLQRAHDDWVAMRASKGDCE